MSIKCYLKGKTFMCKKISVLSVLSFKCSLKYWSIRIHLFMQTVIKMAHYELQADLSTETHSDIISDLMPIFRSVTRGHMAC